MEFHGVNVSTQFKRMRELVPEAYRAFLEFDQKAFKDGAIPGKTKELIALGIAQITQCAWCIQAHALQDIPRLRLPEGQPGRVQAPAARAGPDRAHGNAVVPKRLADPPGLPAAVFVQVALGRAVLQLGVGRIEGPGGVAVASTTTLPGARNASQTGSVACATDTAPANKTTAVNHRMRFIARSRL